MQYSLFSLISFLLVCNLSVFSQEIITKEYLMGKFNPARQTSFVRILKDDLAVGKKNSIQYARTEAYAKFKAMQDAAALAKPKKIILTIYSATRNFTEQKAIWTAKWCGKRFLNSDKENYFDKLNTTECNSVKDEIGSKRKPSKLVRTSTDFEKSKLILEYSSMPTTSRHHWGTDFDLNNASPNDWENDDGKRRFDWLMQNAHKYDFCQPYSIGREYGYEVEKWHWSYSPLSKSFLTKYNSLIKNEDIASANFIGSINAANVDMISNYVLGINQTCK